MEIRPFGSTALRVSVIGLGTAPLGQMRGEMLQERAVETVRAAIAAGARLVDTAPLYGAGHSERCIGSALLGMPRERYVLSSKVGRLVGDDGQIVPAYTRDGVLRSIDASLKRLRTERLDIVHIHDPDDHYREALDAMFPVLADLRAQGVIAAVGAGMNRWQMLADFARQADFDRFLLAGRYTLLEQTSLGFLDLCRSRGIAVILGGVFNSGILATGPVPGARFQYADAPPEILARASRLEAVCTRHGVPLPRAALRFALAHPAVTCAVLGAVAPAEFDAHAQALATPIPAALWADLRREGLIADSAPVPT